MLYRCTRCNNIFCEPGVYSEVPDCNVPGRPSLHYDCCPKCKDTDIEEVKGEEIVNDLRKLAETLPAHKDLLLNAAAIIEWEA